jgi:hypothetical protein
MMHPNTTVSEADPEIGLGVYATRHIPAGSIVYVRDSLEIVIPPHDPRLNDPAHAAIIERYSYIEPGGNRIMSWDIAKYVNHSCDANSVSTGWGFEVALRDIAPGEQITDEYGLFNLTWSMNCRCGSSNCRGLVHSNDFAQLAAQYDRQLRRVLRRVLRPEQPLWAFLDDRTCSELREFVRTGRNYRSVTALQQASPAAVPAAVA